MTLVRLALAAHGAQLTYERARAASFGQALQATWRARSQRQAARAALPRAERRALAVAEALCLQLGLAWPREAGDQCAPWHLPAGVVGALANELPRHPLIEPAWAVKRLGVQSGALGLIDALADPVRRGPLWSGLPLSPLRAAPRLGVVVHLFYPEIWPEIRAALASLIEPAALYITVPEFAATPALQTLAAEWAGPLQIVPLPNRGRDVRPFLHLLGSGALDAHELVCKLHTKRSPHMRDGATWRQASLHGLLGPREAMGQALERMRSERGVGLWCTAGDLVTPDDSKRWNRHSDRPLGRQQALKGWADPPGSWPFAAGTMFWTRPEALHALRQPELNALGAYEPEMAQTDGTWAHALERLIGLAVQKAGFKVGVTP